MQSILAFIKNHKFIVLITLLGPLLYNTWLYYDYRQKLAAQREVNAYLETEIFETKRWLEPIKDLDRLKAELLARMEISQGLTGPNRKKFQLLVLLSALPEGISLQVLKMQEAEVNISGTATSTAPLEQLVDTINKTSICESGKVYPKPGKKPGSFSINCFFGYGYYDEF